MTDHSHPKKVIYFSNPDNSLPAGCWEWVVPEGSKPICSACLGSGSIGTGIDEAPSTICNACDGTGIEQ